MRVVLAKKLSESRHKARDTIQRNLLAYIQRKRWREGIMKYAKQYMEIVVQLQRAFRRKRFRQQVMDWVRKRRAKVIIIQRVWRRIKRVEQTLEFLVKR